MPHKTARTGRKRASSVDPVDSNKRTKTSIHINDGNAGEKSPKSARGGMVKLDTSADPKPTEKKGKVNDTKANGFTALDAKSKRGASPALSQTSPSEARPDLGQKELVQAVPTSGDSADSAGKTGQKKVSSWSAFKTAALKLKEAGHKSVKIEIDPKTPLTKFFPLLPRSVFESTPFSKCALEYRFEPEGDKPAGASFIAELELTGPLQEVWQIFSTVLGQDEPILRVTAFLGVNLEVDSDIVIDSLTLVGCFVGCKIAYPADSKLIRITSLGATISISRNCEAVLLDVAKAAVLPTAVADGVSSSLAVQETLVNETALALSVPLNADESSAPNGTESDEATAMDVDNGEEDDEANGSEDQEEDAEEDPAEDEDSEDEDKDEKERSRHINFSMFGTVELPVPGQPLALALDLDVSVVKGMLLFSMSPKGTAKAWDDVFGFENVDLVNVGFKAGYPLAVKKEAEEEEETDGDEDEDEEKREDKVDSQSRTPKSDTKVGHQSRTAKTQLAKKSDKVKEEEEAKKEKEYADLMSRFDTKKDDDEDTQAFIALQAGWESPIGTMTIYGKITQDFVSSTLKGTLEDVTFAKIKQLFERTFEISLGDTDIDIQAKMLTIELSKEGLRLDGDLTIYGKEVSATVLLSTEGVTLAAKTPKWEVDDEKILTIEDAEVSFFVGCVGKKAGSDAAAAKAIKKSVGWYGGFSVKGTFTFREDLKITVSLQIVRKPGGGWGYIVMGQVESDLSLADLLDYVPKDGNLDFSLKKIWLVASNIDVDPSMLPPDAQQFPVKKGIFLCTYLETVPLIDGDSNLVKKADPKDAAYLYLGLQSGGLPSVAIYLPRTMSIDLGSRAKVGDFYCRLSVGTSGPRIEFIGHVVITLEEKRKFDFELVLAGDAVGGDLSIVMDGIIKNPFGLSERISLGATGDGQKLGFQVGVNWVQLASTGLPSALGLSGTLSLDYDTPKAKVYGMTVNLSENPMDFIIIINATSLSYNDLVDIASALTSTPIPAGDVTGASFKNLEIYASLGGSFGSETYPPGFRMRGIMTINDKETFFTCDISTSGLKLLACVPSFEVGPLKLTGEKDLPDISDWPAAMQHISAEKLLKNDPDTVALVASQRYQGKYAILDLQITLAKQYFLLNGKIEIFGLTAHADIECQYKPTPKFKFDFSLNWSDLIKLQLHAEMLESKHLDRPREADFEVSAVFEQTIIQQIIQTLTAVLKTTSETLSKGVGTLKAEVEALEKKKQEILGAALRKLEETEWELAQEKEDIQRQLREKEQQKADRGRKLEEDKANLEARNQERRREANEKREREKREMREKKNRRDAEENARVADIARRRREKEAEKAQQERDMKSRFGGVETEDILRVARWEMDAARARRDDWSRRVDAIDGWWHPVDKSDARASWAAACIYATSAEGAYSLLETLVNSSDFRSAFTFLDSLSSDLQNLSDGLESAAREAANKISDFGDELTDELNDIDNTCDNMIAEVQGELNEKSLELDNFVGGIGGEIKGLGLEFEGVVNGVKGVAVAVARDAVEKAKNDDTLLVAARTSLDKVDQLQKGAFDALESLIENAVGELVDVQHVSLYGMLKADQRNGQKPFLITIMGNVGGKRDFRFELEWVPWRPGGDDMDLFRRLTGMVMGFLNGQGEGLVGLGIKRDLRDEELVGVLALSCV